MIDQVERQETYTAAEAADLLGVPAHVIRQWQRAGRAAAAGQVPAPVPGGFQMLYTLNELRPLAERWHALQRRRERRRRH